MNELIKNDLWEIEEYQETIQNEHFKLNDLDGANWAFRKLRALEIQQEEYKKAMESEIEKIKMWYENESKSIERNKEFFEGLLTEYFVRQKEVDPKFKISTPYGKVSSRKQQPKWDYDEDKLIKWLKENDKDLIRIKEEVNKNEVKKKYQIAGNQVVTEDGEIVEGVTVEERPDSVVIKVE